MRAARLATDVATTCDEEEEEEQVAAAVTLTENTELGAEAGTG